MRSVFSGFDAESDLLEDFPPFGVLELVNLLLLVAPPLLLEVPPLAEGPFVAPELISPLLSLSHSHQCYIINFSLEI